MDSNLITNPFDPACPVKYGVHFTGVSKKPVRRYFWRISEANLCALLRRVNPPKAGKPLEHLTGVKDIF